MIVINGIVYLHIPQKNNNKIHLILFIEIIVKGEKIENLLHSILKDFFVNICCIIASTSFFVNYKNLQILLTDNF